MGKNPQGRLAQVSGKDVSITPAEHYDGWAKSYNEDLLNEYGYSAHKIASAAFAKIATDRSASIIDVGCGTGLVGLELVDAGFTNIDGVDISANMLAEAEQTGIYRNLILQDVEKDPAIDDGTYDAVISVGSFGIGHMGPEAFGDLVRMAKPGGAVVIFMNAEPFVDENYADHIKSLEQDNTWTVSRIEDHNYMDALDRAGKLIIAHRTH